MCARQDDANCTTGDKRKRPLSIIEEDDADDAESLEEKLLKYSEAVSGGGKENYSLPTDTKAEASNNKENVDAKSAPQVPGASRNTKNPTNNVSKNASVSKSQNVSPKSRPDLTINTSKTSSPKVKQKPNHAHTAPLSPTSNSKIPVLKSRTGRRSALTPTDHDDKSSPTQEDDCSGKFHEASISVHSKNSESTSGSHALSPELNKGSSDAAHSGGDSRNEPLSTNSIVSPRPSGDGNGLARIRETAERLNLTSPSSPMSAPPSFSSRSTTSPKFSHRVRMQGSTPRPYQDNKSPPWQNVPQITITPSPGTPHLVSLALNTAIADADDINNNNNCNHNSLDNNLANSSYGSNFGKYSSYLNSKMASSKLGSYFSRRLSVESTGSLSEGELSDGSSSVLESPEENPYVSDFRKLKETAERLRLSTRRPSTMLWRQQYMENTGFPRIRPNLNGDGPDERLTSDRKQRIDEAIEWLRNELQEMRSQDQNLARQLLTIRHDIHQLKLQRSTEEHQELIDDFQSELEEMQEFSDVLDLPQPVYGTNPLKQIGVTRLNLSARRFSAC